MKPNARPNSLKCRVVNGILLVFATANGHPGYFAFDTGAMQTAVNRAHFPDLEGEAVEIANFSEGVKESTATRGILKHLQLSDLKRADLPVLVMDLTYVEQALFPFLPECRLLGTLGMDMIGAYSVLLDYAAPEIILNPPRSFEHQRLIPMRCDKLPVISIELANTLCDVVLDTGANTCLLAERFRHALSPHSVSETPNLVTIPALRIGGKDYPHITAALSDLRPIQKRVPVEGVIGYQILCAQRVILDFKNQQLILEA